MQGQPHERAAQSTCAVGPGVIGLGKVEALRTSDGEVLAIGATEAEVVEITSVPDLATAVLVVTDAAQVAGCLRH